MLMEGISILKLHLRFVARVVFVLFKMTRIIYIDYKWFIKT